MDYNDLTEPGSDNLDDELDDYADEGMDNPEPLEEETETPESTGADEPTFEIPEKFKDAKLEDVIKSYTALETKLGDQGRIIGTQKSELEQLRKELETLRQTKVPFVEKPEHEDKSKLPEGWTEEDLAKLDDLYVEHGSPAKAILHALQHWQSVSERKSIEEQLEAAKREATEYNKNLALSRGRELLYEAAKKSGNKQLMDKYADRRYLPTVEELEAHEDVYNQFLKEAEYVLKRFKPQDIVISGQTYPAMGKYDDDVFHEAYKALNYTSDLDRTRIETAENTVHAIQKESINSKPDLVPSGSDKYELGIEFTGQEDQYEAARKWEQADPDELTRYIEDNF